MSGWHRDDYNISSEALWARAALVSGRDVESEMNQWERDRSRLEYLREYWSASGKNRGDGWDGRTEGFQPAHQRGSRRGSFRGGRFGGARPCNRAQPGTRRSSGKKGDRGGGGGASNKKWKSIETESRMVSKKPSEISDTEKEVQKKLKEVKERLTKVLKSDKISPATVQSSLASPVRENESKEEANKLQLSCVGLPKIILTENDYREIGSMNNDKEEAEDDGHIDASGQAEIGSSSGSIVEQRQRKISVKPSSSEPPSAPAVRVTTVEEFRISPLDRVAEDSVYSSFKKSSNDSDVSKGTPSSASVGKAGGRSNASAGVPVPPKENGMKSTDGKKQPTKFCGGDEETIGYLNPELNMQPIKKAQMKLKEINGLKISSLYKSFLRYRWFAKDRPGTARNCKSDKKPPAARDNPLLNKANLDCLSEGKDGLQQPTAGGCWEEATDPAGGDGPQADKQVDEFMDIFGNLLDDNYTIPKETLQQLGLGDMLKEIEDSFNLTNNQISVKEAEGGSGVPGNIPLSNKTNSSFSEPECELYVNVKAELITEPDKEVNDCLVPDLDNLLEFTDGVGVLTPGSKESGFQKALLPSTTTTAATMKGSAENTNSSCGINSQADSIVTETKCEIGNPPLHADLKIRVLDSQSINRLTGGDVSPNDCCETDGVPVAIDGVKSTGTERCSLTTESTSNVKVSEYVVSVIGEAVALAKDDVSRAAVLAVHRFVGDVLAYGGSSVPDRLWRAFDEFAESLNTKRSLVEESRGVGSTAATKSDVEIGMRGEEKGDGEKGASCVSGRGRGEAEEGIRMLFDVDREIRRLNERKKSIYRKFIPAAEEEEEGSSRDYFHPLRKRTYSDVSSGGTGDEEEGTTKRRKRLTKKKRRRGDSTSADEDRRRETCSRKSQGVIKECVVTLHNMNRQRCNKNDNNFIIGTDSDCTIVCNNDSALKPVRPPPPPPDKKLSSSSSSGCGSLDLQSIIISSQDRPYRTDTGIRTIKVYNGDLFMGCEDGRILRFKQKGVLLERVYLGHTNGVNCIGGYDGVLVSGSSDCSIRLHQLRAPYNCACVLNLDEEIQCLDIMWGKIFAGTKNGNIFRYSCKTFKQLGEKVIVGGPRSSVLSLKTSKEGPRKILIVSARFCPLTIRDAISGLLLHSVNWPLGPQGGGEMVYTMAFHGVRPFVYCGTRNRSVVLVDAAAGEEKERLELGRGVIKLIIRWDVVFTASYDGTVHIYSINDKRLISKIPVPGVIIEMDLWDLKIVLSTTKLPTYVIDFPAELMNVIGSKLLLSSPSS